LDAQKLIELGRIRNKNIRSHANVLKQYQEQYISKEIFSEYNGLVDSVLMKLAAKRNKS
jgi:hypothetical protein